MCLVHTNNNCWYPIVLVTPVDTSAEVSTHCVRQQCPASSVQCLSHPEIRDHRRQPNSNTSEGQHYCFASCHFQYFVGVLLLFFISAVQFGIKEYCYLTGAPFVDATQSVTGRKRGIASSYANTRRVRQTCSRTQTVHRNANAVLGNQVLIQTKVNNNIWFQQISRLCFSHLFPIVRLS